MLVTLTIPRMLSDGSFKSLFTDAAALFEYINIRIELFGRELIKFKNRREL